jgi:hypothetical protein
MDEATRKRIFLPVGEVSATVLVDGRVEGVWKITKEKSNWTLMVELFKKLDEEHMDLIKVEIQNIKDFTGFEVKENIRYI